MARTPRGAAAAAVVTTEPVTITAVSLDLGKQPAITLIPAAVRRNVESFIADARALVTIGSAAALETADVLASRMKALEKEIAETVKGQLAPIESLIKAAKQGIAKVVDDLEATRVQLAERVVAAKSALGIETSTSCYSSTVDDLKIIEIDKVPRTVRVPRKDAPGAFDVLEILEVNEANAKRALKAGIAVPGLYMGSKTQIATKST